MTENRFLSVSVHMFACVCRSQMRAFILFPPSLCYVCIYVNVGIVSNILGGSSAYILRQDLSLFFFKHLLLNLARALSF